MTEHYSDILDKIYYALDKDEDMYTNPTKYVLLSNDPNFKKRGVYEKAIFIFTCLYHKKNNRYTFEEGGVKIGNKNIRELYKRHCLCTNSKDIEMLNKIYKVKFIVNFRSDIVI